MTDDEGRGFCSWARAASGKTHLAVAVLIEIIHSGKPGDVLFCNFQDLIQEIQATFDNDAAAEKSEILRPLLEADLLVLDELGSVRSRRRSSRTSSTTSSTAATTQ